MWTRMEVGLPGYWVFSSLRFCSLNTYSCSVLEIVRLMTYGPEMRSDCYCALMLLLCSACLRVSSLESCVNKCQLDSEIGLFGRMSAVVITSGILGSNKLN